MHNGSSFISVGGSFVTYNPVLTRKSAAGIMAGIVLGDVIAAAIAWLR